MQKTTQFRHICRGIIVSLLTLFSNTSFADGYDILIQENDFLTTRIVLDSSIRFKVVGDNLIVTTVVDPETPDVPDTPDIDTPDTPDVPDTPDIDNPETPDTDGNTDVEEGNTDLEEGSTDISEGVEESDILVGISEDVTEDNTDSTEEGTEESTEETPEEGTEEGTEETPEEGTVVPTESNEMTFSISNLHSIKYVEHMSEGLPAGVDSKIDDNEISYRISGNQIFIKAGKNDNRLMIYTLSGELVRESRFGSELALQLSDLGSGLYLMNINDRKTIKLLMK
jgi:hypothetical protein